MISEENPFEKPPIFIGGCGRSGTTLLLSILSAHPGIFCIPKEMWALWPTEHQEEFATLVESMTETIRKMDVPAGCKRWCEKTPKNVRVFGQLIEHLGSEVRLIHIVRDGRDVVTSSHPHDPTKFWVPVWRWVWDVEEGLKHEADPRVHTVRYEDLVLSFDETIRTICDFLEEPFLPELLQWHENSTVRRHSAIGGEIKPVFRNSIGRWKRPEFRERIAEFMADSEAVRLLKHLGYE